MSVHVSSAILPTFLSREYNITNFFKMQVFFYIFLKFFIKISSKFYQKLF